MFSYQFLFPSNETVKDRLETFPTDAPEPEISMIYPKSGTFYDSILDTIPTCIICTLTAVQALLVLPATNGLLLRRAQSPMRQARCSARMAFCQQG